MDKITTLFRRLRKAVVMASMSQKELIILQNNSSYIGRLRQLMEHEGKDWVTAMESFDQWGRARIMGISPVAWEPHYEKSTEPSAQRAIGRYLGMFRGLGLSDGQQVSWQQQFYMVFDLRDGGIYVRERRSIEDFLTLKYGRKWKIIPRRGEYFMTSKSSSTASTSSAPRSSPSGVSYHRPTRTRS